MDKLINWTGRKVLRIQEQRYNRIELNKINVIKLTGRLKYRGRKGQEINLNIAGNVA